VLSQENLRIVFHADVELVSYEVLLILGP